ncbi:MAG: hypothetical protein JNM27_15895 [Leptospirales bacterium]|nr:hypothetical protein [Leptospirales bacterium]
MKKILTLALLISTLPLLAGRKEGLQQEFRAVEEAIRNKQTGPEARLKTLESNLVNAVRLSINRHFYEDREKMLKELTAATIDYENPTSPVIYFVKYKNVLLRFEFSRSPELFLQSPVFEKFLDAGEVDMSHKEQPASQPAQPASQPAQP